MPGQTESIIWNLKHFSLFLTQLFGIAELLLNHTVISNLLFANSVVLFSNRTTFLKTGVSRVTKKLLKQGKAKKATKRREQTSKQSNKQTKIGIIRLMLIFMYSDGNPSRSYSTRYGQSPTKCCCCSEGSQKLFRCVQNGRSPSPHQTFVWKRRHNDAENLSEVS